MQSLAVVAGDVEKVVVKKPADVGAIFGLVDPETFGVGDKRYDPERFSGVGRVIVSVAHVRRNVSIFGSMNEEDWPGVLGDLASGGGVRHVVAESVPITGVDNRIKRVFWQVVPVVQQIV